MRYHFFLHYGWFFQNFEKDFIPTLLHTTVRRKKHGGKVLSRKVASLSYSNQGSSREYSIFESIRKFDYWNGLFQYFQSQAKVWLVKKETDLDSIFCLISDFSSDIYWQHSFLSLKAIIDTYYWTWPVLLINLYGCSYTSMVPPSALQFSCGLWKHSFLSGVRGSFTLLLLCSIVISVRLWSFWISYS